MCRCVHRQDWIKERLKDHTSLLPSKRKRTQTSQSPEFITGDAVFEEIEQTLIQPDLTYAYVIPQHMGGRRRSRREIKRELVQELSTIVDYMRKFPLDSLVMRKVLFSSGHNSVVEADET